MIVFGFKKFYNWNEQMNTYIYSSVLLTQISLFLLNILFLMYKIIDML